MDRVARIAACGLGAVMLAPAFVPGTSGPQMRGTADGITRSFATEAAPAAAGKAASSAPNGCFVLGVAAFAAGAALRRRNARAERVQVKADGSGLEPSGPVVAYAKALAEGAAANKESVPVTKDVLKAKRLFDDEEFLAELSWVMNDHTQNAIDRAKAMNKLMKFESTVMPKFTVYLAKKMRLPALKLVLDEYMISQYFDNSIAPVTVCTAQRLTEEQVDKIKDKMKKKIGCKDVKLIVNVDGGLLAGFTVEWGYTDPIAMSSPSEGIDLSLKTYLKKKALLKGIPANL